MMKTFMRKLYQSSIDPVVKSHGPVLRKRKHNEAIMKIVIITIELQIVVINLMDSFLNV